MKRAALGTIAALGLTACAPTRPPPAAPIQKPITTASDEESDNYRGEEGFAVSGVLGTVDPDQVQAAFAAHRAEVDACYAKASGDKPWLGGPLELKLRIAKTGDPSPVPSSVIITQPLGNLELERCITEVAKATRFPRPKGGPEAEVTYGFTFRGRMSLQTWGSAEVAGPFEQGSALAKCGAAPKGLRVAFFVTPGGRAPSVGVGAEEQFAAAFADCAAAEVGRLRFDDPRGKVARAVYQF